MFEKGQQELKSFHYGSASPCDHHQVSVSYNPTAYAEAESEYHL